MPFVSYVVSDKSTEKMSTEKSALFAHVGENKNGANISNITQYSAVNSTKVDDESDDRYLAVKNGYDDGEKSIVIEEDKRKLTNCQTLAHLLKSCMGCAILLAPNVFSDGGQWVGLACVLVCGFLVIEGMQTLVRCANQLKCRVTLPDGEMDFCDVAEYSFQLGPKRFRSLALSARFVVKSLVVIVHVGICAMYLIFAPSLIKGIIHQAYPDDPELIVYMAGMLAIVLPYSLIMSLRHLVLASAVGNILLVVAFALILGYLVTDLPSVETRPAFVSWERIPFLIAKAVFTFEGIGSILPLMGKMRTPEDFGGFSGVLQLGMVIPVCLFSSIGFYGYLRYGDSVHTIITLDLPQDNSLTIACEMMLAIAILSTYGIVFYVAVIQMWPGLEAKIAHQTWRIVGACIFRIILVLLTFTFAVAVPHLDLMLALLGSVAGVGLGLIFPPLLEILCLVSQTEEWSILRLVKDIVILSFGITACVTGTYASVRDIILTF